MFKVLTDVPVLWVKLCRLAYSYKYQQFRRPFSAVQEDYNLSKLLQKMQEASSFETPVNIYSTSYARRLESANKVRVCGKENDEIQLEQVYKSYVSIFPPLTRLSPNVCMILATGRVLE
jgi:hypothetical protein